jgi:hypothetical protein
MKSQRPRWRAGAGESRDVWRDISNIAPDNRQPLERHFLADDVIIEHEVAAIELLRGRVQGPGRLGDLMRSARRLTGNPVRTDGRDAPDRRDGIALGARAR